MFSTNRRSPKRSRYFRPRQKILFMYISYDIFHEK